MAKATKAQRRASQKYEKEKVEGIRFSVRKGDRDIIHRCAKANGESTNSMLYRLAKDEVKRVLGVSEANKLKK